MLYLSKLFLKMVSLQCRPPKTIMGLYSNEFRICDASSMAPGIQILIAPMNIISGFILSCCVTFLE